VQGELKNIHVENQSPIASAENPVFHDRSKHIDTLFNFIQEHVKNKEIFVKSQDQVVDISS